MNNISKIFTLLAAALIIVAYGCNSKTTSEGENTDNSQIVIADSISGVVSVLDFQATWCPPCQQMKPEIERIEQQWDGKVKFEAVDVDKNQELAAKWGVQSIPCLIYLNANGQELARTIGYMSYDELDAKLKELSFSK